MMINDELMITISSYMDDEIRERLHFDLAPCSSIEFIRAYCEMDKEFIDLLKNEFPLVYDAI